MAILSSNLKSILKKVAIFCGLFLVIFLVIFYVVNLDLGPKNSNQIVQPQAATIPLDVSAELKKRLGSTDISVESYADWANRYGLTSANDSLDADPSGGGMPNYMKYVYGLDPLKTDTMGSGYTDKQDIANGYDPSVRGSVRPSVEISISKIDVSAPMVWSKTDNDSNMLADLENGVAHFAKTASPGQNGNMIISGHSSNYIWDKGSYNHIFENLNNLQKGDTVSVRTTQQNGRIITYHYVINDKYITTADDQQVFADTDNPTLTLSTCWPIGTSLKRIIVKAEIAK